MEKKTATARYIKIAQDICNKIISGEYQENSILKGRSVLASYYKVSPETIRKSMNLLARENIVLIKRGVGIYVISVLHAKQFAEKWKDETLVQNKYNKLIDLLDRKKDLDSQIDIAIKDMKDSFNYQKNEAVEMLQMEVPENSWINGKKIGDVYFYNYTEATIVAVVKKVNGDVSCSPGPDFVLNSGDKLIFVAKDKQTFDRVASFLVYGVEN